MRRSPVKRTVTVMVIALLVLLAVCIIGGSVAYLVSRPGSLTNDFVPAKVTCAVEERFADGVKSDVKIRNTGNVDAYIRAAVVVTFRTADGKVLATTPRENVDYAVTWADRGWRKGSDGFWYYADTVAPNGVTAPLIMTAAALSVPEGYSLHVQIIAAAVQSDPEDAVKSAWGITPTGDKLIPQ